MSVIKLLIDETAEIARKDHPLFFQNWEWISAIEDAGLQESVSVRNVIRCRTLASYLISPQGQIIYDKVQETITLAKENLYSPGFGGEYETKRALHILRVLEALHSNKEVQRLLSHFQKPISNRFAEEVIRVTVGANPDEPVTDAMTRQAALCSLLTTLRQSLGSCFATAPCILVHDEQFVAYLKDLEEIIVTGKLKRTFSGHELSVPMSPSWGKGTFQRQVFFNPESQNGKGAIWKCPILQMTCGRLNLPSLSSEIRNALIQAFDGRSAYTSAEGIISYLLKKKWDVRQSDIEEYELRPKSLLHGDFVIQQGKDPSSIRSKGERAQRYLHELSIAAQFFCAYSECPLLKVWEFTIASFAEVRLDFARWNLYSSLGFNHDEVGGIAHLLYETIQRYIDITKRELEKHQEDYNSIVAQVNFIQGRVNNASTESEVKFLKMEYQARQAELYNIQKIYDNAVMRSNKMANLYQILLDVYDKLFSSYFQEVYDADIHDITAGPFDDSPAGFRLVYKHGRSSPGLWTRITNAQSFVDSLASFFTVTEQLIKDTTEVAGIDKEVVAIISQTINHVRSDEFLLSAFQRMALAHGARLPQDPLKHIDQIEKKPWVYTSGGSMHALVGAYFKRDDKPQSSERWIESETELLAFLIDLLRQNSTKGLQGGAFLMHSPTHAFLLLPHEPLFSEGWAHDVHSYSWIKYNLVESSIHLLSGQVIGSGVVEELSMRILEILPSPLKNWWRDAQGQIPPYFLSHEYAQYVKRLISERIRSMQSDRSIELKSFNIDSIDSCLYSALPFTLYNKAQSVVKDCVESILKREVNSHVIETVFKPYENRQYIAADEVLLACRRTLILGARKAYFSSDVLGLILKYLRERSILQPAPLLFADSNWVKEYFSFVVNPATFKLEFWCMDPYGIRGEPISHWKMWLNGSRRDKTWGVFTNKIQYTA